MDKIQERIISDFALFDDWMDKYNYLIEQGTALPPIDPAHRTERYAINGCQSRVWLVTRQDEEGRVWFTADSDAIITKGIISLLIEVLNGRTPCEILDTDLYFIDRIGLRENLSPTRANGLAAMVKQMKMYALAFDAKKVES
ncbi:MAG: SufE family protein [Alistipes sp.]|jgi:cysteine desulfuration protein SufE|nr:SufE family protein [Alistipes sp.]